MIHTNSESWERSSQRGKVKMVGSKYTDTVKLHQRKDNLYLEKLFERNVNAIQNIYVD